MVYVGIIHLFFNDPNKFVTLYAFPNFTNNVLSIRANKFFKILATSLSETLKNKYK